MGSSLELPPSASSEFLAVFRAHADASNTMTFARFMELALYAPEVGYYRREHTRVGYARGTDFFTASTSGPVFGELVNAAATSLLQAAGRDPAAHHFVEIGPETPGGVLTEVNHGFRDVRLIRVGEAFQIPSPCVVFSNELFDAQPCTRTIMRQGVWREIGVRLEGSQLCEVELSCGFTEPPAAEGYQLDRPLASKALAEAIAAQSWEGLFIAIDYGRTWQELVANTPQGTARAYFRHTQSNDLLARPGQQDLTCHVCWDWIEEALRTSGFSEPRLESQESFFIRHAARLLEAMTTAEAGGFSRRKLALMQLLHPSHLGQKFQVLHAMR